MNRDIQKELTEKWILPNQEDILDYFFTLRARVDEKLKKDPKIARDLREWKKEYPIGLCAEIRNEILDMLFFALKSGRSERGPVMVPKGLETLRCFIDEGGKIIPFWGVDKDRYFQNAIMLGDAVLDVANDTVSPYKKPIEFYPNHEDSPLKMIELFSKVAEIDEKYWKYDVYPNIYFPELAPLFPILAIVRAHKKDGAGNDTASVDGLILQQDFMDLDERNIHTVRDGHVCGLASDFIFNSAYSHKRLPEEIIQNLTQNHSLQRFPDHIKELLRLSTDPEDARAVFKTFAVSDIQSIEKAASGLKGILLAKKFAIL